MISVSDLLTRMGNRAKESMYVKYMIDERKYNIQTITNIIYNEKMHIVSEFKELLLYDDQNEFLKRYYTLQETMSKLESILEFYETNSKIFPNYVTLPESKYLFKNIKKKQKMLDNLNEKDNNDNQSIHTPHNIFNTQVIHSLISVSSSITGSIQRIVQIINEQEKMKPKIIKNNLSKHHKKFIKEKNINPKVAYSSNIDKGKYIHKLNMNNIIKKIGNKNTLNTDRLGDKKPTKIIIKEKEKKKETIQSSINHNIKKPEAKSMPKLSYKERLESLNQLTHSNLNKKRIISPNIQFKQKTEGINIVKVTVTKTKGTKYSNYQNNIIKEKNIPSLHISFSKHFNSTNNKSKSPHSNSNSINKNNIKNPSFIKQNNIRTLIHKDIIASTEDGRHTERIKQSTQHKHFNTHKKIISATSSYDYNKLAPKTTRGTFSNNINPIHRIIKSNQHTQLTSNKCKLPSRTNSNNKPTTNNIIKTNNNSKNRTINKTKINLTSSRRVNKIKTKPKTLSPSNHLFVHRRIKN